MQVDATTGLNADGVVPLQLGVPAYPELDNQINLAAQANPAYDDNLEQQPRSVPLHQHAESIRAQAQYPQESRAAYPLASSIVGQLEPLSP